MDEHELQDSLQTLLDEIACMDDKAREDAGLGNGLEDIKRVRTYGEVGMLTKNAGLVITTADGSEFQVTIVQSR